MRRWTLVFIGIMFLVTACPNQKKWEESLKQWEQAVKERDAIIQQQGQAIKDRDTTIADLQAQLKTCQQNPISDSVAVQPAPLHSLVTDQTPTPPRKPVNTAFDFRKVRWGMKKDEVIKLEGKVPETDTTNVEGFNNVVYLDNLIAKPVGVIYHFVQGKVFASRYQLMAEHTNNNDFLKDFEDFHQELTKKYGPPIKEETNWKNDLLKDDPQRWGMAIATGDLEKFAYWETTTTKITLQLKGENFEMNCAIRYETKDPALQKMVSDHKNAQTKENL